MLLVPQLFSLILMHVIIVDIFEDSLIYMALFMTVFMTVGLTIYACTTKTDFTIFIGIMWVLCIGLLIFAILLLFTDNIVLHIAYCVLAIIVYGIYLIIDT